jgi:hypothetical protein
LPPLKAINKPAFYLKMAKVKKTTTYQLSELLTRSDVANHFKISLVTLHHWTQIGLLKSYYLGGRVYYKKDEIDAAITEVKPLKKRN